MRILRGGGAILRYATVLVREVTAAVPPVTGQVIADTPHQVTALELHAITRRWIGEIKMVNTSLQTATSYKNSSVRFGAKVGQIGPKWDKSRPPSDLISVHFGSSQIRNP